ncbi:MAG: hypothetical protein EBU90_19785 [Proteobacteria bacterium]|jgi:hypothetical protein|nr:hypothetical protein [Pseudomonadota bacterium]
MKDWDIILVKNTKGNILQRIYWWLIRLFTNSNYNHAQLVRDFNGELYICESEVTGFRVTKTLNQWWMEQDEKKREFIVINIPTYSKKRFNEVLGNRYDAKYWTYITKKFSSIHTSNCFQALAYIFRLKNYWLATANTLISSYKTVGKNKINSTT